MSEALEVGKVYVCKVKKLLQHGIIVQIDETDTEGFIHISELSKRWVRDVKDIAKENDTVICKLTRLEPQSIELSIKRITDNEKRQALKEWSLNNRLNKLIESNYPKNSAEIINNIKKTFGSLYEFYTEISKNKSALEAVKLSQQANTALLDFVEKTRKKIVLKTELTVQCTSEDGIDAIKKFLLFPYIDDKSHYTLSYIKAPKYSLVVDAGDTKKTLSENKKILDAMDKKAKEFGVSLKYKEVKG